MSAFDQARHCALVKIQFGPTHWKRSDIDDLAVLLAYREVGIRSDVPTLPGGFRLTWPDEFIAKHTGAPLKVVRAAVERAVDRGLIDYGVSARAGWPTAKGEKIIADFDEKREELERMLPQLRDNMLAMALAAGLILPDEFDAARERAFRPEFLGEFVNEPEVGS